MSDLAVFFKEKKWDLIVITILILVISVVLPLATKYAVQESVQKSIAPMQIQLSQIDSNVAYISTIQTKQILENGLAGYKKISTIDQLETNTQNAAAIKTALSIQSIRDILFSVDRDKTIMFEDYFKLNGGIG